MKWRCCGAGPRTMIQTGRSLVRGRTCAAASIWIPLCLLLRCGDGAFSAIAAAVCYEAHEALRALKRICGRLVQRRLRSRYAKVRFTVAYGRARLRFVTRPGNRRIRVTDMR